MIALTKSRGGKKSAPVWHDRFLEMLPKIREQARSAFCYASPEAQEDLITEVVANACVAFARLVERGKPDLAYPTPLAQFAIRQVRSGRRVGSQLNAGDVSSCHVQRSKGFAMERLDQFDHEQGEWREALVEDRQAGPAATAIARIDLAAWFKSLARGKRKIAKRLACGETTSDVARMFGLTAGRVSQLRRELKESWELFQCQAMLA